MGAEAKKLFDDANALLNKLINDKSLTAHAVFSFHKANSNDSDDIMLYDENNKHIETLHGLRQQVFFEFICDNLKEMRLIWF